MKKPNAIFIVRFLLLSGTVASLFFVPWILVKAWILPLPNTVQEQVDQAISYGFDGMIVYVQSGKQAPRFYTGGYKDRNTKIPAEPHSLFKIASISKLYVAVSITKLVAKEHLSLDATISDFYPELVGKLPHAEEITIRQMVQHRSGMPDFTYSGEYWQDNQGQGKDPLDYALNMPTSFAPGEDYEYSNTNYLFLRRIIERTVGYDHLQYIEEEILQRLGLKNTYRSLEYVNLDDVMSGYYVGDETDYKSVENGMLATAQDVGIFLRALNDGSVFDEGEQEIFSSIYVYEHGGLVPGYQSLAEYNAELDTVVVQFISTTDFNGYEWNLSQISLGRIFDILENE